MNAKPVVLITGCALGIGRALAEQIAARGVPLALLDIDAAALTALGADIAARWPATKFFTARADVVDRASVETALNEATAALGPIEVVINNAGGVTSLVEEKRLSETFTSFAHSTPDDWRKIVDLNLFGALNVAHAALPAMLARGSGRIVFVSSVSGLVGSVGLSVYAAAKGGVIALTKSLARELAQSGISVNSVAPGGVATRVFPAGTERARKRAERIPMGRLADPHEVANVIAYLALDAPDYLTGEIISVSGGPA